MSQKNPVPWSLERWADLYAHGVKPSQLETWDEADCCEACGTNLIAVVRDRLMARIGERPGWTRGRDHHHDYWANLVFYKTGTPGVTRVTVYMAGKNPREIDQEVTGTICVSWSHWSTPGEPTRSRAWQFGPDEAAAVVAKVTELTGGASA